MSEQLDDVLAHRLRVLCRSSGRRQQDLARDMKALGFRWWSANRVAQLMTGRGHLSLVELAGVCFVLRVTLKDLLVSDVDSREQVLLPGGSRVPLIDIAEALGEGDAAWTTSGMSPALLLDESVIKVARRIGVDPMELDAAARDLWGHSMNDERDRRLSPSDAEPARRLQARRGHITRALLEELRAHMEPPSKETGS